MKPIDEWKDEVMNSLDGIQRATAPPGIWDGIKGKITPVATIIRWPALMAAAAVLLLLLFFNFYAIQSLQTTPSQPAQHTIEEGYSVSNTLNLYE